MCNIYTNEHYWVIGSNTSKVSAPIVGQPCQCGSVRWGAAQQPLALDLPETWAENEHPSACIHRQACIFYKSASR